MPSLRTWVGMASIVLITACSSQPRVAEPVRPATLPRPPSASTMSPAAYVAAASAIDLYVIKASELALQRSAAVRVREVATRLIAAHNGSSAQLSLGGRRLNLLPTAELQPRHKALLEALYASGDFDRDYARQMKAAHEEAVRLHARYAASGSSPTLIPIARALTPVMEQQVRLVSYL